MLQIVIAVSAVSPIVLRHRFVIVLRFWLGLMARLAFGFVVATLVYFGVLFVLAKGYSLAQPLGVPVYILGFLLATLLSVIAGTFVSPARLARIVVWGACTCSMIFPVVLYVYVGLGGAWHGIYLTYAMGSIAGVYVVSWLALGTQRTADAAA